jgi:hypothetical protein
MSDDSNDTVPPESLIAAGSHEANGKASGNPRDLSREVVMLRARCSNLRHWCRLMLEDPASSGVLPESTVTDLLSVAPEVSEPEGQEAVALLARGEKVPQAHPLAPTTGDPISLKATVSRLSPEWERLRQSFFKLFDHLHPGDDLTEEYLLEQRAQGPLLSMGEIIAEFEREFGGTS